MSLTAVGWLFTLGVLAHNTEEALYLPAWSRHAGRWHVPVGAKEFRFAVAVLSAALLCVMAAASKAGAGTLAAYVLAGYVLTMVLNVPMPHVIATIAMRRYMPGTATAVVFNLPLGCLFLSRALSENYIEFGVFAWSGPLTALLILASLPILFAAGKRIRSQTP